MTKQEFQDRINFLSNEVGVACREEFIDIIIKPRYLGYPSGRFMEICMYLGKTHKYNSFPNLALFCEAEEETQPKKTIIRPPSKPLGKKEEYTPKEFTQVFSDLKQDNPWMNLKVKKAKYKKHPQTNSKKGEK